MCDVCEVTHSCVTQTDSLDTHHEFASVNGAQLMRHNAACEFVVQVACIQMSRLAESYVASVT